jgi:cytochrome c-type protein NapC
MVSRDADPHGHRGRDDDMPKHASKPWRSILIGAGLVALGALLFGGFAAGLEATNQESFCIGCHSMKTNYEEYKKTAHYRNPSGVRATCADCHVPRELGPKLVAKIMAAKDVYHEILGTIDTPEKYEANRWAMANAVWTKMKASDSRECRACHTLATMDLAHQGKSAAKKHARVQKSGGKTCIDCHAGVAHKEPDAPPGATKPGKDDDA